MCQREWPLWIYLSLFAGVQKQSDSSFNLLPCFTDTLARIRDSNRSSFSQTQNYCPSRPLGEPLGGDFSKCTTQLDALAGKKVP